MDVRMPDGTTITNVPEGTTQTDLQARLDKSRRPAEPTAPPDSFLSRVGTGLADPLYGAAQLADKVLVNPIRQAVSPGATSMADVIRQRESEYHAPEGVDWGRIAGNVVNPVNYLGGAEVSLAGKALPRLARVLEAAPTSGARGAAATGAAQAALAPVNPDDGDYFTEKAKQAGLGGLSAGVLAKVLPRALSATPIKPTADARALQEAGVALTPGQAAGGWANAAEQKAMSLPFVGDIIGAGRRRALDDFQARALERATGAARGEGPASIDAANEAVSGLYQAVVPKLRPTEEAAFDVLGSVAKAADNPELTTANRQILEGIHDKLFGPDGERYMQLSGNALKDLDTELGALGRKYRSSVLPSDQTLGQEIGRIQQTMREAWKYHLDPADAANLAAANRSYRQMIPVNKAASQRADDLLMPRAYQKALARQEGRDVTRMPPDALVDPAVSVLRSTVPDSGTAGRLALPAAIVGGLAAPLPALAGGVAALGAYSRAGSNLLTGNTRAQRFLADRLERAAPATRKALIAALRAQQADAGNGEQ